MKTGACAAVAISSALLGLNDPHAEKMSSARPLLQIVFRSNNDVPINEVSCSLHSDRLVIERKTGELRDVQESRVDGLTGEFANLIAEATKEPLNLADGPVSAGLFQWVAFAPGEGKAEARRIVLKSTGSKIGTNPSVPAKQLIQFIDLHCRHCYLATRGYPF